VPHHRRESPLSPDTGLRLSAPAEELLAARLRALGLHDVSRIRTHQNRSVLVSLTAKGELRVHREYAIAPDRVLHAIVRFVAPRTRRADRRAAERVLLSWPISSEGASPRPPRAADQVRPGEEATINRLETRWQELNNRHFGGILAPIPIGLSSRMVRRLGELVYDRVTSQPVRIVISRRLLKQHPWREVEETLLHEMVHQWQAETGGRVDHGAGFRKKALEVGIVPRAVVPAPGVCGSIWARVEKLLGG
jgi:hypothetical protein